MMSGWEGDGVWGAMTGGWGELGCGGLKGD